MGTIGNQPKRRFDRVRADRLIHQIEELDRVAEETGKDADYILRVFEAMAYQDRTRFMAEDGDYRDEHVAGFADLVRECLERYLTGRENQEQAIYSLLLGYGATLGDLVQAIDERRGEGEG